MADKQPTQNADASTQNDDDLANIQDIFYSGMRVMAGSYLLARLRLALSINLVITFKDVDEESFDTLYCDLKKFKGMVISKQVFQHVGVCLKNILKSLNLVKQIPHECPDEISRKIRGIHIDGEDISNAIGNLRHARRVAQKKDETWSIQESPLLKEAMEHISSNVKIGILQRDLEGDQFMDFSQRVKVAVVHGLLTNLNVGLPLFTDTEQTRFHLFKDWKRFEGNTPFELLEYIHGERNKFAHTTHLDAREEIVTFVKQFDQIDEFLDQYFEDVDPEMPAEKKRTCLKHLFSDIPDYMTTNKLTNAYTNFKEKLIDRVPELMSENECLQQNVSRLEEEKKQLADDVWSTVEEYCEKHQPTLRTAGVYKKLQELVRNPAEKKSRDDQLVTDLRLTHTQPPRAMQLSSTAKDVTPQMPEGPVYTTTADESSQAEDPVGGDFDAGFDGQKQDAVEDDCWP